MTLRLWATLVLWMVGCVVYATRDFQCAHPVWLNWFFAITTLIGFPLLANRYQKELGIGMSGTIGSILFVSVGLPLLLNVNDTAPGRDAERVSAGTSRDALFRQMESFTYFGVDFENGIERHEFGKRMAHDNFCYRIVFLLRKGVVVERSVSTHTLNGPFDHQRMHTNYEVAITK